MKTGAGGKKISFLIIYSPSQQFSETPTVLIGPSENEKGIRAATG
jgi:hypothetical protein